eukprot:CAMPEP_0185849010 /NCGR_PEP_ID=MMETSP1354-20130828/3679_1 /TAXON_ID=708628 /ORGANISM="Erythrolobus madagascarensis, Strain CCMP3276" /LENGTH=406 /DNA_ID=CAMNT_0028549489 /DNA_START=118 /DNA_END=1338 /DNA_ORIENTATION=-
MGGGDGAGVVMVDMMDAKDVLSDEEMREMEVEFDKAVSDYGDDHAHAHLQRPLNFHGLLARRLLAGGMLLLLSLVAAQDGAFHLNMFANPSNPPGYGAHDMVYPIGARLAASIAIYFVGVVGVILALLVIGGALNIAKVSLKIFGPVQFVAVWVFFICQIIAPASFNLARGVGFGSPTTAGLSDAVYTAASALSVVIMTLVCVGTYAAQTLFVAECRQVALKSPLWMAARGQLWYWAFVNLQLGMFNTALAVLLCATAGAGPINFRAVVPTVSIAYPPINVVTGVIQIVYGAYAFMLYHCMNSNNDHDGNDDGSADKRRNAVFFVLAMVGFVSCSIAYGVVQPVYLAGAARPTPIVAFLGPAWTAWNLVMYLLPVYYKMRDSILSEHVASTQSDSSQYDDHEIELH